MYAGTRSSHPVFSYVKGYQKLKHTSSTAFYSSRRHQSPFQKAPTEVVKLVQHDGDSLVLLRHLERAALHDDGLVQLRHGVAVQVECESKL